MENWTCVFTADQMDKAELVKEYLANENIEAFILDKRDSSRIVFSDGDVELYVPTEDENKAAVLVNGLKIV